MQRNDQLGSRSRPGVLKINMRGSQGVWVKFLDFSLASQEKWRSNSTQHWKRSESLIGSLSEVNNITGKGEHWMGFQAPLVLNPFGFSLLSSYQSWYFWHYQSIIAFQFKLVCFSLYGLMILGPESSQAPVFHVSNCVHDEITFWS